MPTIFSLVVLAGFQASLPAAGLPVHPRLILTPTRAEALRSEIRTVPGELWPPVLESAEQLAKMPTPAMRDANNRLRFIGDTMPALGLAYRMTGDRRYAEAADRWLRALVAVPSWNRSANLGRSSWVVGCALLYDWLYDVLPTEGGSPCCPNGRQATKGRVEGWPSENSGPGTHLAFG